jgi:hypothetical protein
MSAFGWILLAVNAIAVLFTSVCAIRDGYSEPREFLPFLILLSTAFWGLLAVGRWWVF